MDPQNTLVDLNRSGVALMEIVSKPDMRTPDEVSAYIKKLRSTAFSRAQQTLGVPFEILHLDELDSTLYSFKDSAPCVDAVRGSECSILLSKAELALCDSDVDRFFDAIKIKLDWLSLESKLKV